MAVVGFSFSKILVERKKVPDKGIKVKADVKVTNVSKESIWQDNNTARFEFEFTLDYEEAGNILFLGDVLFMDDPKKVLQLLETWKKQKAVPAEILKQVLNAALYRCNIKALEFSQEIGLPPHLDLPRFVDQPAPKPAS